MSGSLLNWAILPNTGRYWFETSSGGATITYYDPLASGWGPSSTQFGSPSAFALPAFPDGGTGSVMSFPAANPNQGYRVNPGASAATSYSMIWDYLSPAGADGHWRALYQANTLNSDDGEFFIRNQPGGGIGINGIYHGSIAPDTWNRIAVTRNSSGVMNKYINGALVGRVPGWLRIDLELFIRGGLEILDSIRRADFDVWTARPTVSRGRQLRLLAGTLARRRQFSWLGLNCRVLS